MRAKFTWMPGAAIGMAFMGVMAGSLVISYPMGQAPRGLAELAILGMVGGMGVTAIWVSILNATEGTES